MTINPAFRLLAPLVLASAAVSAPHALAQAAPAATQALLEKAHALEVRGRVDMAAQTWQQVLLADPNNTEALGGLARAAKLSGNQALANTYLDRLRAINPNDPGIARAENLGKQSDQNAQLQQAGKLAQQGQYGQAMAIYRQLYGTTPPAGDIALAYYETEAATEEGRPEAIAGLRGLTTKFPGDSRYQVALGRILTYNPKTRAEGRKLLAAHPYDPAATEALRQSLVWDAQNPATAGDIRGYLAKHPDAQLAQALRDQPRVAGPARAATPQTPEQRAAAAEQASRSAEDNAAYRALNAKHIDQAEQMFKAILAKRPEDAPALAGMGYVRMQQANFGGAISFILQAKQDGSKDPGLDAALATSRFWYTMGEGQIALNESDLPTAEKQYRAALGMRPTSVEALEALGGTLLKAQQPQAAAPYFAQFVKLKPSAAHAWRGLFLADVGSSNAPAALALERQMPAAVRAELMKDPLYLRSLSTAYSSVGRDADAQRVLRSALDLPFPADAKGMEAETELQYAALLEQAHHLDQAAGLYRQVLAADQGNVGAWQGLVRVEHTQSEDAQALETIQSMPPAVYDKAVRDVGFEQTVASIYQSQNRLDLAQDALEKALLQQAAARQAPSLPAQVQLAGIYLARNDAAHAYPLYQQILTHHPDRLDAWKGLLASLHATGHDSEALAQVQQIPAATRAQLEGDGEYLQTVASIYNGLGQPQQAQVYLRRVEQRYAAQHEPAPASVEIQDAWLLYNTNSEQGLYRQLLRLGSRNDLTDAERRTVQSIWANWAVRRANQASAAGKPQRAVTLLNATARSFGDNPGVIKTLSSGYATAGQYKQAIAIWKAQDMTTAPVEDYRAAVGAALAGSDTKDAETWLRFGLNQYPKDPELLNLGAKFEQLRGDSNRAADYYRASLGAMPKPDPGAELATELSQPAEPVASQRPTPDLATLMAPTTADKAAPAPEMVQPVSTRPYLPGFGTSSPAPVILPDSGNTYPAQPAETQPAGGVQPGTSGKLGDYVPQASLRFPLRGGPLTDGPAGPLTEFPTDSFMASVGVSKREGGVLVLSPAMYQQGAHFVTVAQTSQAGQTAAPVQNGATGQDVVYQPYRPYTPPQRSAPLTAQPATAPGGQVLQPGSPAAQQSQAAYPSSGQPSTAQVSQPGTRVPPSAAAPDAYGPYVPYQPPVPTVVPLGTKQASRPLPQPEVTDVLPKAKYLPNANQRPAASHPEVNAANAAAARRRQAGAAATGESRPPAEDYSTPPTETVQYNSGRPSAAGQVNQPARTSSSAAEPVQQTGDSYGQQYPQPNGGSTAYPVSRGRARAARRPAVAAARSPEPAVPQDRPVARGLSYPGVGQALTYQPYPTIGPEYPLGVPPTDQDLMERDVPPLRGPYYTGPVLAPQVALTPRQRTERDLQILESSYSGWLGGTASARYRSGTAGLDRLTDLESTVEASVTVGNSVRFTVVPRAVFLNSGSLDTVNYTTTDPVLGTLPGNASNPPSQQFVSGVGGEFQVAGRNFAVAAGYTPYEFLVRNVTARALFQPTKHFTLYANRDSVTQTQLSYAGLRDPGSATPVFGGNIWGGVVQTGGGVRFDYGDERAGFYVTADGADLTGYHVLQNSMFEGSAGAYFLAHTFPGYGRLNVGASLFGMHYAHNERGQTYGLGGYFSPDAYFLATVPVTFIGRYTNRFHYTVAGSVGVQTFQEDNQIYYPLDRALQTGIVCTNLQLTTHTCGQLPANSNTGGNYSINSEGAYRITDHWFAGGFFSANNTNNYNTVTGGFFVRYLFRPQVGADDYPTGLFPVEGFRPLRVP